MMVAILFFVPINLKKWVKRGVTTAKGTFFILFKLVKQKGFHDSFQLTLVSCFSYSVEMVVGAIRELYVVSDKGS